MIERNLQMNSYVNVSILLVLGQLITMVTSELKINKIDMNNCFLSIMMTDASFCVNRRKYLNF